MSPLRDLNVTPKIADESIPPRLFSEKSCMPLTDTLSARTALRQEPDSPGKFYFKPCEPREADVWTL